MKDLDLNELRVFVRVVDRGAFAVAARELRVPTSTVSRTVARLEERTGTRLLQRTPRSVRATSEGHALYASVSEAVGALERAAHALEPATRTPKGILRVTAPTEIDSTFLADVAVTFGERYPLVQIELALTNRAVNLVDEGFDVAVRAAGRLPDSSLVAKKLGDLEHALYASPHYLERHGAPSCPADLGDHRCIVFRAKDLVKTWRLHDDKQAIDVPVRARMGGDDFSYLRAAVVAGGGIALMPRLVCSKDELAGRLVRVLPSFAAKGAGLYVMYPSTAHVPARVTAFRNVVVAAFDAWRPIRSVRERT
ncbi:MAG TPA: LysR family transcriptional regulator [Kofleriaceae bacterium]|nr:LysR family transcriptional regulator [Kofleriaceae bacterium]